jgi:hypothetical protein
MTGLVLLGMVAQWLLKRVDPQPARPVSGAR